MSDHHCEPRPEVAVAIPCYNEAAAIGAVVEEWRSALPGAEVVVFDNNSTDGSPEIARQHGARIVSVPEQGKGFVVRAIFDTMADRAAVVMIDGDGTYPADAVRPLLDAVRTGRAEMAVGARKPEAASGAMSPVRGLGNSLIGIAFRVLIGRGTSDLLSGYRVFSKRFMTTVTLQSKGFEIETELASEATGRGVPVVELPVPYRPRIAGTSSKLRAFRDGVRILRTIVRQSFRLRPWRPLGIVSAVAAVSAAIAEWSWLWWVALGAMLAAVGAITAVRGRENEGRARRVGDHR